MKNKSFKPPFLAKWLLGKIPFSSLQDSYLGDLDEDYIRIRKNNGLLKAYAWYWLQAINSSPNLIKTSFIRAWNMYGNYLRIGLRNLIKHKGYSFINVTGLAVGMACSILITLWVLDELSYDRFHENAENLYRIEQDQNYNGRMYRVSSTPSAMAPAIREEIPEVVDATRVSETGSLLLRHGDAAFFEQGVRAVDPSFLTMFTHPFIAGDMTTALNDPLSIVISESLAKKYFGDENPLGKTILINNEHGLTVTGVIRDVPENTIIQFDMLVPYAFGIAKLGFGEFWNGNVLITYARLRDNVSLEGVGETMTRLTYIHRRTDANGQFTGNFDEFSGFPKFHVRPLTEIHLYGYIGFGTPMGNIQYVYIFSIIALFVLLIACINFMNLSTARSANRAKEIGMRKVAGALRGHIIRQFYSESVIFAFIALFFSLGLVAGFLPTFNFVAGKSISLETIFSMEILLSLFAIAFFTGIVSGSYPALFLSSFTPVKVLKSSMVSGAKRSGLRRLLVVLQFSLSILLIIGTGTVYSQLDYMRNKDIGYEKEQLVYITLEGGTNKFYDAFKQALLQEPNVISVSASRHLPSYVYFNSSGARWGTMEPNNNVLISHSYVDLDFIKTIGIELLEGRDFSAEFNEENQNFIINETLAKIIGKGSVIDRDFYFISRRGKIVGVMKDYHHHTVKKNIEPLALVLDASATDYAFIRIVPKNISETIETIQSIWTETVPNYPFNYKFMDESFENTYRTEEQMGDLLKYFSILAVLIACLGLFGLASFTAEQRRKEIGIRKVLGASPKGMIYLLCREFLQLVLISYTIALPVAWVVMRNWQQSFAYRPGLSLEIFASAGIIAFIISLLTVSFQAVRAATTNPVTSLKYE